MATGSPMEEKTRPSALTEQTEHTEHSDQHFESAQNANQAEHKLKFLEAIKLYPKAVGWSIVLSSALIMEGYDLKLIPQMFAQSAFQRRFGVAKQSGKYQISAPWQAGLTNGTTVGSLIGLLAGGWIVEHIGFRKTMMASLSATVAIVFLQFFATGLEMLEAAQILMGIPMGVFQSITTHYAVEVTPTCLRGYLTTYVNLCFVLGQLCSSCVMRGFAERTDQWAYKIPFAIQWVWPIPLLVGVYLAPESPWWLVRRNRISDAKAALLRLTSQNQPNFKLEDSIALMIATTEHEHETKTGTSYRACFRGVNLRRTIVAVICYLAQGLCGAGFRNYSTYFYQQAGLPTVQAFNMTIIQYVLGIIGVVLAWVLLPFVGRRTLYLWGLLAIALCHLATGGTGVAYAAHKATGLAWAAGSLLLLFTFFYDVTIGPVAYALVSEVPSVLLRGKTIVIARMSYTMFSIISNTITPYMLNPTAWNWGARAGFFWGGTATIMLVVTFFMVPETKDRTFYELDMLFEQKVPARHFPETKVGLVHSMDYAEKAVKGEER